MTKKTPTSPSTIGIRSTLTPACAADLRIISPHWFVGSTEIHSCSTSAVAARVSHAHGPPRQAARQTARQTARQAAHRLHAKQLQVEAHVHLVAADRAARGRAWCVSEHRAGIGPSCAHVRSGAARRAHLRNCWAADGGIGSARSSCGRKRIMASPNDSIFEPPIAQAVRVRAAADSARDGDGQAGCRRGRPAADSAEHRPGRVDLPLAAAARPASRRRCMLQQLYMGNAT